MALWCNAKEKIMDQTVQEKWAWVEGSHALRTQLLDTLSDSELSFTPGGKNPPLGALFREMGQVEISYTDSFKTLKQDWTYKNTDQGLDTSLEQLKTWFSKLDGNLKEAITEFSAEDLTTKIIERGGGFNMPVGLQIDVYTQALLIFIAKIVVYFKAMNKELPQQVEEWIG
jgi:hypothetical protein